MNNDLLTFLRKVSLIYFAVSFLGLLSKIPKVLIRHSSIEVSIKCLMQPKHSSPRRFFIIGYVSVLIWFPVSSILNAQKISFFSFLKMVLFSLATHFLCLFFSCLVVVSSKFCMIGLYFSGL